MKNVLQIEKRSLKTASSIVVSADTREDTNILAMDFVKEELGVDIKSKDIGRSRLVCRRSTKPRPLTVRL